jgi:uncharacterized protein YjbI with pentapeptide repeats
MSDDPGGVRPRSEPANAGQPTLASLFRRLIQLLTLQNILTIVEIIGVPVAIWALWLTYEQSKLATEQVKQAQVQIDMGNRQIELGTQQIEIANEQSALSREALQDQRIAAAWQILATKGNGSTGKQYALGTLMAVEGRLSGIDLSCELAPAPAEGLQPRCDNQPDLRGLRLVPEGPQGSPPTAALENSKFRFVDLSRATIENVLLSHVDLEGAFLTETTFAGDWLRDVKLRSAYLVRTVFTNTTLERVDLSAAYLVEADFGGVQFPPPGEYDFMFTHGEINLSGAVICSVGNCAKGITQSVLNEAWYLYDDPPLGLDQLSDQSLTIMSGCRLNTSEDLFAERYICNSQHVAVGAVADPMPYPF